METEDPRFSLLERNRADVDLAAYRRGRINFFIDTELIMGSERRAFDLNQANIIFETSASYRVGLFDIAGVVHHVSRHVVDREFDRVPAWHTIGPRIERTIVTPNSTTDIMADYGYVVQHTFVDYRWTSQLTLRVDRTVGRRAHLFASGRTGSVGVDRPVSAAPHRMAAASRVGSIFPASARFRSLRRARAARRRLSHLSRTIVVAGVRFPARHALTHSAIRAAAGTVFQGCVDASAFRAGTMPRSSSLTLLTPGGSGSLAST